MAVLEEAEKLLTRMTRDEIDRQIRENEATSTWYGCT